MSSQSHLYKQILLSQFADVQSLKELARFYDALNKPYVGFLCRLASLLSNPIQPDIYKMAVDSYRSGVGEPATHRYLEPPSVKISVIIATLNRPETLKVAIQSVLAQNFQNFEIIVINNGGTSDAQLVVDSFQSDKTRYLYEAKPGQYIATNTAIKEARGEYITYLDDDDIMYPNHLETLYGALCSRKSEIIYGRNRWIVGQWANGQWIESANLTKQESYDVSRLYSSCTIANQNVLHSRDVIEKIGLYQDQSERGCDWEFRVRCSRLYDIHRIDTVTSEVRVPSILPANQPLRAQFYSQLWPIYFRSGFGELVLAIAAWENGCERVGWEHIEKIDTWQYMDRQSLNALWNCLMHRNVKGSDDLWENLANYQPIWLIKKVTFHPNSIRVIRFALIKKAALSVFNYLLHPHRNSTL